MAFFLTPRHAPTFQAQSCNPFGYGFGTPAPRPSYRRVVTRPPFPSFFPFLTQVDELLTELDREARRAQHQQRQQRKRTFRARFDVHENKEGYQVLGEIPGFEQENISVEVTDEHTLKVSGTTEMGKTKQPEAQTPVEPTKTIEAEKEKDNEKYGVTLIEAESVHSDTSSQKSYQATVEDDFEDLGAETSSTLSEGYNTEPKAPKGKAKAVDEPANTEAAIQPAVAAETQPKEPVNERQHGSFERTFRFPERIDGDNVRAALKNGVLSIAVPKAPAHSVRHIAIQ